MNKAKIYYLKQEVQLNQEIDFNGLKIKVTQDLIDNNPNLFEVKTNTEENNLVLCIESNIECTNRFIIGNVYKFNELWFSEDDFKKHFVKIDRIGYLRDAGSCIVYKYYKTAYGYYISIDGKLQFSLSKLGNFESTQREYEAQQNIIKNLPKFVKSKDDGKIYMTEFKPNQEHPIQINPNGNEYSGYFYILETLLSSFTPSTEEEYNKQQELQIILKEAQERFPIGTKVSKDTMVKKHSDNKTYLVYNNGDVRVYTQHIEGYIGGICSIGNSYEFIRLYGIWKEPYKEEKNLQYYEDNTPSEIKNLKTKFPKLYYSYILQQIANDLNGDLKPDWSDTKQRKYYFYYCQLGNRFVVNDNLYHNHSYQYFVSEDLAKKAIEIISEENLLKIF